VSEGEGGLEKMRAGRHAPQEREVRLDLFSIRGTQRFVERAVKRILSVEVQCSDVLSGESVGVRPAARDELLCFAQSCKHRVVDVIHSWELSDARDSVNPAAPNSLLKRDKEHASHA